MIDQPSKRIFSLLMATLLCVAAILPAHATVPYETKQGATLLLPYPQQKCKLEVTDLHVVLDVPEFPSEQMGANMDDFCAYGATATVTLTLHNPTDRPISITMCWDVWGYPSYASNVKTEQNLKRYLSLYHIGLDGNEVEPKAKNGNSYGGNPWVEQLTYSVSLEPGQSVVNTLRCPIYPTIEDQYEPAVYSYTFTVDRLQKYITASDIRVEVLTEFELARGSRFTNGLLGSTMSSSQHFNSSEWYRETDDGYEYASEQGSRYYYTVLLSENAYQSNPRETFEDALPMVVLCALLAVASGTVLKRLGRVAAVVAVIATFAVLFVRQKRARRASGKGNFHEK